MEKKSEQKNYYWNMGFRTVKELETPQGIMASGSGGAYACVFGRDSLITSLKLLRVYRKAKVEDFLHLTKRVLVTLYDLQGKEVNIESGEEPGKCIHEFRPDKHEHLSKHNEHPWYLYPDNTLKNYDTVDATLLLLITTYRYWQASGDDQFIVDRTENIQKALQWIWLFGDSNNDGFLDYQWHPSRQYGGSRVQSWMDSHDFAFHEDDTEAVFPIAPAEVQAYAYLALRLWANYFAANKQQDKSLILVRQANMLKRKFNEKFIVYDDYGAYIAAGLDGAGRPMKTVRSSMGHALWAALNPEQDGALDAIVYKKHVPSIVKRLTSPGLFESLAGVRTLSSASSKFNPRSYHNGTIWPHDNGMIAEGLENFGYKKQAKLVRDATLTAVSKFDTPIELFVFDKGEYLEYKEDGGHTGCKDQAWSAACILDMALSEMA